MNAWNVLGGWLLLCGAAADRPAAPAPSGFLPEMPVKWPTRLDWEFAAATLLPDAPRSAFRLPPDYELSRQRYQLFVPPAYRASRPWPLIVFVSPGDDPLGWRAWQKLCEDRDVFFCAAYGAGNNCAPVRRVRLVLDVLDDVRRRYRIDPARTYLAGFAGGGRLACALAFALPEYFGGVVGLCGGVPPHGLDYLRQRVRDRLAVALATGAEDFDRRETEVYLAPLLADLGVHSRLWVVPRMGHELPPPAVLAEVYQWLEADLPRRLQDARDRPDLAVAAEEVPLRSVQAERVLAAAEADCRELQHIYRGAAMLLGIVARWEKTDAADRARELLREVRDDARRLEQLRRAGGAEERQVLAAQARALDRFGQAQLAREAWETLARNHPGTPEGTHAAAEARRLAALLAATPYLGVVFEGETTAVRAVVPRGPAARAGLRAGDRLVKLGDAPTASLADVRAALQGRKPGDRLTLEVRRGGEAMLLPVEVGTPPPPEKE
jgi:predicted esterase